jgi:hypothetical protein
MAGILSLVLSCAYEFSDTTVAEAIAKAGEASQIMRFC